MATSGSSAQRTTGVSDQLPFTHPDSSEGHATNTNAADEPSVVPPEVGVDSDLEQAEQRELDPAVFSSRSAAAFLPTLLQHDQPEGKLEGVPREKESSKLVQASSAMGRRLLEQDENPARSSPFAYFPTSSATSTSTQVQQHHSRAVTSLQQSGGDQEDEISVPRLEVGEQQDNSGAPLVQQDPDGSYSSPAPKDGRKDGEESSSSHDQSMPWSAFVGSDGKPLFGRDTAGDEDHAAGRTSSSSPIGNYDQYVHTQKRYNNHFCGGSGERVEPRSGSQSPSQYTYYSGDSQLAPRQAAATAGAEDAGQSVAFENYDVGHDAGDDDNTPSSTCTALHLPDYWTSTYTIDTTKFEHVRWEIFAAFEKHMLKFWFLMLKPDVRNAKKWSDRYIPTSDMITQIVKHHVEEFFAPTAEFGIMLQEQTLAFLQEGKEELFRQEPMGKSIFPKSIIGKLLRVQLERVWKDKNYDFFAQKLFNNVNLFCDSEFDFEGNFFGDGLSGGVEDRKNSTTTTSLTSVPATFQEECVGHTFRSSCLLWLKREAWRVVKQQHRLRYGVTEKKFYRNDSCGSTGGVKKRRVGW
ncbi:unnamed protein product [Amoebophrya sp. A120]|nr:unnamed protein product [Amoebophrya sp. A120]|eukprot:GSA120T00025987001.1